MEFLPRKGRSPGPFRAKSVVGPGIGTAPGIFEKSPRKPFRMHCERWAVGWWGVPVWGISLGKWAVRVDNESSLPWVADGF